MKVFTIGDIHGRIEALKEVLTLSKFDYNKDKLIVLGDVVDGGSNTYEVIEELLKIKNLVFVIGNHDEWFMDHLASGWAEEIWTSQGGKNTIESYGGKLQKVRTATEWVKIITQNVNIPVTHQDFFNRGVYYYVFDNMLFVHGGIEIGIPINKQEKHILLWDRNLIEIARAEKIPLYDRVFVGHTTTQTYDKEEPIFFNNLIMMDCGAGWSGKLCIMNVYTKEYWLSKKQIPAR